MTSYDGGVYYGITADRDLLPDADLLGPCLREALDELRRHRDRRPARGRRAAASGRPRSRRRRPPSRERPRLRPGHSSRAGRAARRPAAGPLRAHAVTDALRVGWPEGDEESGVRRADGRRGRLGRAARRGDRPRRSSSSPTCPRWRRRGEDPTLVDVAADVVWKHVAAAHADTADDADQDDDLAWFATQEIPYLRLSGVDVAPTRRRPRAVAESIASMDAITYPPAPTNEPNLTYAPGSPEREALVAEIEKLEQHRARPHGPHRRRLARPAAVRRSRSCSRTTTSTCWAS